MIGMPGLLNIKALITLIPCMVDKRVPMEGLPRKTRAVHPAAVPIPLKKASVEYPKERSAQLYQKYDHPSTSFKAAPRLVQLHPIPTASLLGVDFTRKRF